MAPSDVLLVLLVSACTVQVSLQGANDQRLLEQLFKEYNKLLIPVANESEILSVNLGMFLIHIMDLDEVKQVLTTSVWVEWTWNDYRLQWDTSQYNGLDKIRLPDDLLWKPDILLFNSVTTLETLAKTNVLVSPSGACYYLLQMILKSHCKINLRWFPFDTQKCDLKFGSWTYMGSVLDLKKKEAVTNDYVPTGEWDLVEITAKRNTVLYECCPKDPYYDVTYTIVMRRRTPFYVVNLLIPCILISVLALLVFLLPVDSGEKISLGITVMLSLMVFMLLGEQVIPASSDSVPLIAQYFVFTKVIVALSVIVTVVVLKLHHHDPSGAKMPKWIRVLLFDWCAWLLCMKRSSEDKQSGLTNMESIHSTSPDSGLSGQAGEGEILLTKVPNATVSSESELTDILDEVRYIAKRLSDQNQGEAARSEWKFAAAVIDRLFFVIFSLVIILCTFCIMMSAPN